MADNSTDSMFGDIFADIDLTDGIKSASKQIGEQVSGIKDITLSAVNTGSQTIKSGVALINGLDTQIDKTVSAFKSETLGKLNDLLTALSGGIFNIDDFSDLISLTDGLKLNMDSLYAKISSLVGFDVTNIKGFVKNFESRLVNQLNNLTGGYLGLQVGSSGSTFKITSDINSSSTQQTIDTLSSLGIGEYSGGYNKAVQTSFNNALLDQAIYSGLVDAYEPIIKQSGDTDAANNALISGMSTAISNGDSVSLASLRSLLTVEGSGLLTNIYPNGAADLTQYFKIPSYATSNDYSALGDELWENCLALNGENWWKVYTLSFGWVPNLLIGSQFSSDVIKVWMDRPEVIPLLGCANRFKEISGSAQFLQDFPNTPVTL